MAVEDENVKGFSSGWGLAAKPCDSCNTLAALILCKAHSAFLCVGCDSKIHAANKLASRHERIWMCEVCNQAPAAVTCKADAASLCVTCDQNVHSANLLAGRHERVPVVPFIGSTDAISKSTSAAAFTIIDVFKPAVNDTKTTASAALAGEEADAWLIPNPSSKTAADFIYSDVVPFQDFNYNSSNLDIKLQDQHRNLDAAADGVVPTQPKGNLNFSIMQDNCSDIGCTRSKLSPLKYSAQCVSHSVSSSDVGLVPDGNSYLLSEVSNYAFSKSMTSVLNCCPAASTVQAPSPSKIDREAKVLRYREKKKKRKFEKTIRYASRKAYAETRPRVKGRFAKRSEIEGDVDQIYRSGSGGFMVYHGGFGIVPSF
ncbi:hypothetical protein Nepgr_025117 [Nepenthes gracilis]|uniref:Uncharacterized protein n=1 Tax=Nepenthes gracilis TaxID=150966 RepID=A0AAD3T5N5_NEPGR|nr:hypothetical protein Nepgr_025117 [Nepenthes gracilis]